MKKRYLALFTALLLTALLLPGCAAPEPEPEPVATVPPLELVPLTTPEPTEEPTPTPEPVYEGPVFSVTAVDGQTVDESYIKNNKLTMIQLWATWCGPCVGEMPDLAKLHAAYADKGFGILGVMANEDAEGAQRLIESTGVTYPLVPPEQALLAMIADTQYVPTTLFVDAYGRQVGETLIGSKSYDEWAAIVDSLLGDAA